MDWEAGDAVLGVKKITKIGHDKNAIFMYPKKRRIESELVLLDRGNPRDLGQT